VIDGKRLCAIHSRQGSGVDQKNAQNRETQTEEEMKRRRVVIGEGFRRAAAILDLDLSGNWDDQVHTPYEPIKELDRRDAKSASQASTIAVSNRTKTKPRRPKRTSAKSTGRNK
jgi:hypothetical protein